MNNFKGCAPLNEYTYQHLRFSTLSRIRHLLYPKASVVRGYGYARITSREARIFGGLISLISLFSLLISLSLTA